MITLRLDINEVNDIYSALKDTKAFVEANDLERVAALTEKIKSQSEADVSSWDGYVTNEVNSLLELFLPISESGNVGIKYEKAKGTADSGEQYDIDGKAQGVYINIVFNFENPIDIDVE